MEDVVAEPEKPVTDKKDDVTQYLDCVRLVEGGHIRRFENAVTKFDVVQFELNKHPNKPLLFYAIEHNDEVFVKLLLEMEVPLNKSYTVSRTESHDLFNSSMADNQFLPPRNLVSIFHPAFFFGPIA